MLTKELPFSEEQIVAVAEEFPTPFHLYSEAGIRTTARRLNELFDWVRGPQDESYINYFAVKALPNNHILKILAGEGMGADASSGPEISLARGAGLVYPYIMLTANHTKAEEYQRAYQSGAIINLDDIGQIDRLQGALEGEFPDTISFRYNPGDKKVGGVNEIIGNPVDTKFGTPDEALEEAYRRVMKLGVKHFGIHAMVASNELDAFQHIATARLVFQKVAELSEKLGIEFEFANLGGGLGIPYHPEEQPVDYAVLRAGIEQAYKEYIIDNGLPPLRVMTENGRHVTGPNGVLVTRTISTKDGYHHDRGVDASTSSDLPRTANYDAWHHITVIGKKLGEGVVQRVVGSLCEDNDYFTGSKTKERELPSIGEGDLVVMHDTGAHCRAMGSNYNGKLRCAEVLLKLDGSAKLIRREETEDDLFATLVD